MGLLRYCYTISSKESQKFQVRERRRTRADDGALFHSEYTHIDPCLRYAKSVLEPFSLSVSDTDTVAVGEYKNYLLLKY